MRTSFRTSLYLSASLAMGAISLTACGGPEAKRAMVENRIQSAIEFSAEAKSASELETNESGPRAVMIWAKRSTDPQIAQAICDSLQNLEVEKLVAFEKDIRSGEFNDVFVRCNGSVLPTGDLIAKLEQYWIEQRAQMSDNGMAVQDGVSNLLNDKLVDPKSNSTEAIKFNTRVQKMDYTDPNRDNYFVVGGVKKKELVLTFDDGPAQDTTPLVLNALREMNAKAMFFMMGMHAQQFPKLVKAVAEDEHVIGSHTYSHPKLGPNPPKNGIPDTDYKKTSDAISEIVRGHQAIMGVLGWIDPIFRFPYGNKTPVVAKFVKDNEMGEFFWAFDSRDWSSRTKHHIVCPEVLLNKKASCANTPVRLLRSALYDIENAKDKNGNPVQRGIVLFHDIQRRTAEMLPEFLQELHGKGYNLVVMPSVDAAAKYNSKLKPVLRP